jgi:hypothetical protein
LCWSFHCVNDNAKVDLENTQIMCCILCHQKLVIGINPRTQVRKILIFYYKTNGVTSLKRHVDANHILITKMFEKEVNFFLKRKKERQLAKERLILSIGSI